MTTEYASKQPQGFQNHVKNIAMVGAGGRVGRYMVEELQKTGKFNINAVTREDSPLTMPEGVTVKKVNYDEPSTLVEALKGNDVLIITMSVMAPRDTSAKLITAAAEAKVPYILPNEWGSDHLDPTFASETMIGEAILANRKLIEEKGVSSYIAIVCGFWYEYSLAAGEYFYGFDFGKKQVTFYDDGNTKMSTSTWVQVGRAVAALLSLKILPEDANDKSTTLSQFKNSFCRIQSFRVSQREMLASVLRVSGESEKDWTISYEDTPKRYQEGIELFKSGDRSGFAKLLYARCFYPNANPEKKLNNDELGLPKEDFDEATKFGLEIVSKGGSFAIP